MPLSSLKDLKVLVVDDDPSTRLALRAVLRKQGYQVVEADNGQAGVDAVQAQRPHLVLMDVVMPVLDGYSACAQMRLLTGDESLPIVMLTAADDMGSIEMAFNAGATDFITKPINWPLLTERVRYALRTGHLNREVRRSRLREAAVRRVAGLGHWEWSLDSGALDWSDELELLTGVAAHQLRDLSALGERAHPDDRKRLMAGLERARETGTKLDLEFRLLAPGGERVLRLVGERGTQGEDAQRVFGVFQDLTDSRRTEALVDFLAMHDELTGLGNRRLFLLQVRNAMDSFRVQQRNVLLVGTIDLSRFGRYNDSLGEALADKLLSLVGQRLKDAVGPVGAEVARIGGDEFAVMVVATDEASAAQRFQALLGKLSEPFRLAEHELFLALSAGFAVFAGDVSDADALLKHAQEAQRNARRTGQPCLRASSDPEVARQQRAQLELERGLHKALERQEFFLLYQPQLDFASGRITGAEALIRWRHPELGVVPPVHFVPLLEETGLIHEVGAWVVQEACRQAAAWERQGLNLRIGINLSPRQFLSLGLFDTVAHACRSAGASPRLIELEITESLAMQDVEHSIQLLEEFRQAGFQIAIDDFGIGHSSMAYLMKFPIDVIKIDRAFVTDITQSMGDRAIVRAIVVLAQALGMSVIAEGVETQRQCDFIEAVGVNEVQGYLLGKPMSAHALEALARDYTRPR